MGIPLGDEPAGNQNLPASTDPGPSSIRYIYEAKIKNTGEKTIRAIFWTYLLFDKNTGALVGRHRFRSNVTIRGGKSVNLVARSRNSPVGVINASKPLKDKGATYDEAVMIDRIEYADDTVWQLADPYNSPRSQP